MNALKSTGIREEEGGRKETPMPKEEPQAKQNEETASKSDKQDPLPSEESDQVTSESPTEVDTKHGGAAEPSSPQGHGAMRKSDNIRKEPDSENPMSPHAKKPHLEQYDDAQIESGGLDESSSSSHKSEASFSEADDDKKQAAVSNLEAKVTATIKAHQELEEDEEGFKRILGRKVKGERRLSFPQIMMKLLEDAQYKDALCWLPDGLSFAIDPEVFQKEVIPIYFRGSKFDSFKRKVNRWGFKRIVETEAPGTMTYYHKLFRRGYPGLLKRMNGGRIVQKKPQVELDHSAFIPTGPTPDEALLAAVIRAGGFPPGLNPMFGGGMQFPGAGGALRQFSAVPPQMMNLGAEGTRSPLYAAEMERILMEQERLRQELARKSQEEAELRQKLHEEVLRRKAQEEQMREILLAQSSSAQSLPPQMATGILRSGGMPAGFPGMGMPTGQLGSPQVGPRLTRQAPVPAVAADPAASNFAEFLRLRNLDQQQQGEDFERRVQDEIARRRENQGGSRFS